MTWTTEDGRSGGEPGENHLLEGCKKGDRTAQRKLFDALAPKMMALCLRYTGDSQTAEDVLQDGFVTLFTRLDSYSGKGSFEGWARKIFVNTALMHLRRTDALKLSDPLDGAVPLSSPEETPSQALGYKELLSLVSRLPAGYRTVFNMYAVEGFTHREIAESLGITEATSRSKLMRARALLQEMIKTGH